jgi:Tol biopolymer transport system component
MTRDERLEMELPRELDEWLADAYVPASPRNLTAVVERTREMRQRPAWASLERWLPMAVITARPELATPMRMVWLLLITLLVLTIAIGGLVAGSRLLSATAQIPQGGSALLAFGTLDDGPTGQKAGDIYTVRADGTDLRQLTDGPAYEADPAWSPDGTRIAFRSWDAGTESVVVMDADGGNRVTLASSQQLNQDCLQNAYLAWAPDGESLVFPTRSSCGPYDLMIVATDGTEEPRELPTDGFQGLSAAWSPSGDALAVIGQGDEPGSGIGLYIFESNEWSSVASQGRGGPRLIGPDLGSEIADWVSHPSWSPDGSTVVVGSTGVHVVPVDGSEPDLDIEDGTIAAAGSTGPVWSPDGGHIAFQRTVDPSEYFDDRPCTVRTWLVAADGSGEQSLDELSDGCAFGPSWSPDGTRLLTRWIDSDPANTEQNPFYLSVVTVYGSTPLVQLPDSIVASWQPVVPPA